MPEISQYLDFVLLLFLAFGIAFEVPVATVLLAATGLVKVETMTKNRGYVILGIFIIAAFLTPADAISQSFMAVPMCLLYEIGIVLSRILLKQRAAQKEKDEGISGRNVPADWQADAAQVLMYTLTPSCRCSSGIGETGRYCTIRVTNNTQSTPANAA